MSQSEEEQRRESPDLSRDRKSQAEAGSSGQNLSPPSARSSRINKLYRCPVTPDQHQMFEREKSFVIDSVAVSKMQDDFFNTNPKLGAVIGPYNAQRDGHCRTYFYETRNQTPRPFTSDYVPSVGRVLRRTGQTGGGNAIQGVVPEKFHSSGYLHRYFSNRNQNGIGHSLDSISGHHSPMMVAQPLVGYNGQFGFRRNTPELRNTPSPFGVQTRLPLH